MSKSDAIKALSLWQPWASAIALGLKRIETRSWRTRYRGALLIHAAKADGAPAIYNHLMAEHARGTDFTSLPRGSVVAIADLVDCLPAGIFRLGSPYTHDAEGRSTLFTEQEYALGDYSPGRFGWVLVNVRPLHWPCRGRQRLFDVELVPHLRGKIEEARRG